MELNIIPARAMPRLCMLFLPIIEKGSALRVKQNASGPDQNRISENRPNMNPRIANAFHGPISAG